MPHDIEDLKRSLVSLGASQTAHLDVDLLAHMTNVYLTLDRMARPEHVVLAGLFHGVYGTHALNGTQVFALHDTRRAEVRDMIGERAEQVVYRFCAMTYESVGRSVRLMLRGKNPELWDRCTNAPLPATPEEFEELLWVKLADLLAHVPQLPNGARDGVVTALGPFWQLVAEHLGPPAIEEWNAVFFDSIPITAH